MTLTTSLTDKLGIDHPILLAPMGDAAGGHLAAAVSQAGGLGLIGGGYADPTWLTQALADAGGVRVGVGFITFALSKHPRSLRIALDAGVPAVQLSFGDPRPFADTIHGHGAMLICQVQSDDEVDTALEAGADVIIAQGRDAGGHGRPDRGTIALVPSVVDRVHPTPVVAAGGIADGRGLAAALMLGAGGVSIGTRLLASNEALSSRAEADAILASRAQDTVRTSVFDVIRGPSWPDGHDGRAIRNDLVDRWHHRIDEAADRRRDLWLAYQAAPSDDYTKRALWAGEGLDLVNSIEPAATIVHRIVADAADLLSAGANLLTAGP